VARRFRPGDVAREKATERINFLVTPAEKAEIRSAAKMHGRSVTDYLLTLHRLTVSMMVPGGYRQPNCPK
jgi:hypothetical protein